jgi:hypothetical protein
MEFSHRPRRDHYHDGRPQQSSTFFTSKTFLFRLAICLGSLSFVATLWILHASGAMVALELRPTQPHPRGVVWTCDYNAPYHPMVQSRPQPPTRVFWNDRDRVDVDRNDDNDAILILGDSSNDNDGNNNRNGTNASMPIACQFHPVDGLIFHFPHTMQQLYRCWSLWRHQTMSTTTSTTMSTATNQTTPTLIFPRATIPDNNALVQGFIEMLQERLSLRVVRRGMGWQPKVPNNHIDANDVVVGPYIPYYAFGRRDDAAALRRLVFPQDSDDDDDNQDDDSSSGTTCLEQEEANQGLLPVQQELPRIAILNRFRSREWPNAKLHHATIQYGNNNVTIPIRHVVFDNTTTFTDQVTFFHDHDIIVGPHGAQLTSLPFMRRCGAVIELFHQYYLPHFFGSLATSSRLHHGYIARSYASDQDVVEAMRDVPSRNAIRNCPVRPPPPLVDDAIRTMIDTWRRCQCRRRARATRRQ